MLLTPWIESVVVAFIGLSAFLLGRLCSRLPKPYWLAAYLFPLGVIILYGLGSFQPRFAALPPLSWLATGRGKFIWFNVAAIMALSAPLARLPSRRSRIMVTLLAVVLSSVSVIPFLA